MIFVVILYGGFVYLIFFRFRLLPWNMLSQGVTVLVGITLLIGFMVGLQTLTPSSVQAAITARIVEIAPQVSGRVVSVDAQRNVVVEEGEVLYTIDPTQYRSTVNDLLAELSLLRLREQQFAELAEAGAGSDFEVEKVTAEIAQTEARLTSARFALANTQVRAPSRGMVPRVFLKEGIQVSPGRSVLAFVDVDELMVGGLFQQKALPNVKLGDMAKVSFAALPGRIFISKVAIIPGAIGDAQLMASGQLPTTQAQRMTRLYPIYVELPEDFPGDIRKVGLAAKVYIHTENAGVVGSVASAMQLIASSLDAVL